MFWPPYSALDPTPVPSPCPWAWGINGVTSWTSSDAPNLKQSSSESKAQNYDRTLTKRCLGCLGRAEGSSVVFLSFVSVILAMMRDNVLPGRYYLNVIMTIHLSSASCLNLQRDRATKKAGKITA
jgi:hypothetical protein